MVQLMNSSAIKKAAVKLEVEEVAEDFSLEDQLGPLQKRPKLESSLQTIPGCYNPLDEPSPLGLRLKKSPSFLDLIQMKLSQQKAVLSNKKCHKSAGVCNTDKLKASNFPASLLKIGTWEYKSRYEGDLVAKCYFAKHKLVWEVLDGGLKNKIEIQWSDIVAIGANFPDNEGPETLDVVLARQPLFSRETNPQPRKHTLWQATSDFTGGQASMHRRHFLQCQQGFMGKHFEKLIQCDPRLNVLSRQPEIIVESPYFEQRVAALEDLNESNNGVDLKAEEASAVFVLQDAASPSEVPSSSLNCGPQGFISVSPEKMSQENPSRSVNSHTSEEVRRIKREEQRFSSRWDQIEVPRLQPPMSISDLVNHIGHCISDQMTGDPFLPGGDPIRSDIMEEITQYVLSDFQLSSDAEEQSLMSRVNSLCCLLHKDPVAAQNLQGKNKSFVIDRNGQIGEPDSSTGSACQNKLTDESSASKGEQNITTGCKQLPAMSRNDSVGELLLNLPRIASLPQFLYNI